jgi:hypothetical protein
MQPNVGPDEIQNKLSAFSHSLSLNNIENVRNYLFLKIYIPPGGLCLKEVGVCSYVIVRAD